MSEKTSKRKVVFRGSQAEHAYRVVLDLILRGRLVPGSPLSRRGLAKDLNLGVQPVTEALQRLEVDGLVESLPRVGTHVKIPSEQEIRGHYIVREALESQSARLFAEKASSREKEELSMLAAKLDSSYNKNDTEYQRGSKGWEDYWFDLHTQHAHFHMRVAECTGCRPLCEAMEKNQIVVFNWLFDIAFQPRTIPAHWHSELMQGLNSGEVETADRAMREHVRYGMEEVLRRRESYRGLGPSIGRGLSVVSSRSEEF
jgi:DNA-binding GntR family transcriptional regulator